MIRTLTQPSTRDDDESTHGDQGASGSGGAEATLRGEGTLGVTLASVAVGLVMAAVYFYSSARMQLRLSHQPSHVAAVLSVAALVARLTGVGLVILLLDRFTSLDIVVTATSFVCPLHRAEWGGALALRRRPRSARHVSPTAPVGGSSRGSRSRSEQDHRGSPRAERAGHLAGTQDRPLRHVDHQRGHLHVAVGDRGLRLLLHRQPPSEEGPRRVADRRRDPPQPRHRSPHGPDRREGQEVLLPDPYPVLLHLHHEHHRA